MKIFRSEEDCRILLDLTTPETIVNKNKIIVNELSNRTSLTQIDKDYLQNLLKFFEEIECFEECLKIKQIFDKLGN